MTELYYWLFNKVAKSRHDGFWMWCWRRVFFMREIGKHLARRNWRQATRYLKML